MTSILFYCDRLIATDGLALDRVEQTDRGLRNRGIYYIAFDSIANSNSDSEIEKCLILSNNIYSHFIFQIRILQICCHSKLCEIPAAGSLNSRCTIWIFWLDVIACLYVSDSDFVLYPNLQPALHGAPQLFFEIENL